MNIGYRIQLGALVVLCVGVFLGAWARGFPWFFMVLGMMVAGLLGFRLAHFDKRQ